MNSIHITLPDFIKKFIEQQVAKGKYASRNDYILALLYKEQSKDVSVVEQEDLDQSANLYAEVYEQDQELKELTEVAGTDLIV